MSASRASGAPRLPYMPGVDGLQLLAAARAQDPGLPVVLMTAQATLQSAIQAGHPELIPWLFVGKVALEDIPILAARAHEGVVRPPHYMPQMFRDMNGLAIWLGVSSFWGRLNNAEIARYHERLFGRL